MSLDSEVQDFITRFEERAAPIEQASGVAWWDLATTGTEEARERLEQTGVAYNDLFASPAEFEKVRSWHEQYAGSEVSLLGRQVEVLYKMFAAHQGEREILDRIQKLEADANAVYNNHRGIVGSEPVGENGIREILKSSSDGARRREAWEASKTVGREVAASVRELARLRNRLAREAGYPDHFHRSLDLQDIDAVDLEALMSSLEEATDKPFRELKSRLDARIRKDFGVTEVMPWHLTDPFFQSYAETAAGTQDDIDNFFRDKDLEALTRRTYDNMGLEVRDVLSRSDLHERPGKSQHAFCIGIGRDYPYDVRVLANVRPDSYWMDTMLHEFGHAVYDKHINPSLPYLLRTYAHLGVTEAVAIMMGSLAEDPAWLSTVAGIPEVTSDGHREELGRRGRSDRLVFMRWALVVFHFEKALYEDPDREDLNTVWWDLVERLQLLKRPPNRDEPDWAAKIHIAVAPVYYHNYVLGHLISAQLKSYLESYITGGPFYESEVSGRYLLEAVFGPGARDNWRDTILRATGEPLNPDYFIRAVVQT